MSESRRRRPTQRQSGQNRASKSVDLWRPVPLPPDPELIVPANDPTALLRSLGTPPLDRFSFAGERYLATAVERAAALAVGLAGTAHLLAGDDEADEADS
jgi:hypothetical protein